MIFTNHMLKTQISFEAAHRLYNVNTYSKECRENIHGHSYKVTVYVCASDLDESGMVVDFKLLKKILKESIEDKYDHSCILVETDPLCEPIKANCTKVNIVSENPTAEWMASHFMDEIQEALSATNLWPRVGIFRVDVQETENNIATYELPRKVGEVRYH